MSDEREKTPGQIEHISRTYFGENMVGASYDYAMTRLTEEALRTRGQVENLDSDFATRSKHLATVAEIVREMNVELDQLRAAIRITLAFAAAAFLLGCASIGWHWLGRL